MTGRGTDIMKKTENEKAVSQEVINRIDASILALLNERLELIKQSHSSGDLGEGAQADDWILNKAEEDAAIKQLAVANEGLLDDEALRRIFVEIMAAGRKVAEPKTVSYFGPEGTFTHRAARNYFDASDHFSPQPSIRDVFEEVEKGACRYGVVPVENSIEGPVNPTLDLFLESGLNICAENYLLISHDLLSKSGKLEDIRVIYSHPQPFAQCRGWLKKHLPDVELVECGSTTQAAQRALGEADSAAIASNEAARLYGLEVVAPKIQDFVRNTTRFLIIGKDKIRPTGRDKTSLMFVTNHVPGALFKVLEPIARGGLNMLKLESRPAKYENWNYVFFVDVEGHVEDAAIRNTLAEMKGVCQFIKILGAYPMAQ